MVEKGWIWEYSILQQYRILVLSLIEENNWTEILGVLEQTTDDVYHAALLLERITRFRQKQ